MAQPTCGRIAYSNDLPIYAAFDAGAVEFPGILVAGVPAALNEALLAGRLDCSPISSIFYAQHADEFVLLPRVCIGSHGAVRSIVCVSATPPALLADQPIAVTSESATGKALFETICRLRFGFEPKLLQSDRPRDAYARGGACVLIGDSAIDAALAAPPSHVHDIGALWHEHFVTPMVYAVWAARREFAGSRRHDTLAVLDALTRSKQWGEAHADEVERRAQAEHPRPAGFYASYYQSLNFNLDASARAGLLAFFTAAASCGVLTAAPRIEFLAEELAGV